MKKRIYRLGRRAEQQHETRERIVDATIALHEELGPRATTVSAIAERAGVQRLTVYRHFPDDVALLEACTTGWLQRHPPPGFVRPAKEDEAHAAVRIALESLYRYYRSTRRMWEASYRDVDHVPALQGPMKNFEAYLARYADALRLAFPSPQRGRRALRATLALVLRFETWRVLDAQSLSDAAMTQLAATWLEGVA